ncbi:MAG: hypothetical protein ACRDBG_04615 [Waterburya sp.]
MTIIQKETGRILIANRPSEAMFEKGYATEKKIEVNSQGLPTTVGNRVTALDPKGTLTMGRNNIDITALQEGKEVLQSIAAIDLPYRQQVRRANYNAVPSGKIGYGVIADIDGNGWYQDSDGNSIALIQQNFATFNPNTPKSFAIGTNFERKFSDDLVTERRYVALKPKYNAAARQISEEDLGILEIHALQFTDADSTDYIYVPDAIVDPSGSGYKPKEGNVTINLLLLTLSGCNPYYVYNVAQATFCE